MFYKRYLHPSTHFDTELRALKLLNIHAPRGFRFVDCLGACPATRTLVFPLLRQDATQAAAAATDPSTIVTAVCRQLTAELAAVEHLPTSEIGLRAAEPWHFLQRMTTRCETERQRIVIQSLNTEFEETVVFRYDPQLDNFLIDEVAGATTVWSNDFSMWRRMHVAYPFAFLWHDLVEWPRPRLEAFRLRPLIVNQLRDWAQSTGRDASRADGWLLAGRAEALAHEVDGYTRRGNWTVARTKWSALSETLCELESWL